MDAMPNHDLDSLIAPLGDESPTGENLEYDQDFLALDRAASPKAERAIGDSVKAAEEPDWEKVSSMAEALLQRSKDLRIATHLATAWMRMDGMQGWADGLGLIHALLENFWDGVHPQLDAEDDNDPTARVNAVAPISDTQSVLGYFRTTPFVQSPRLGRFSLRDLQIAQGTLKISTSDEDGGELPTMTDIEACCLDCPEEQLVNNGAALNEAFDHARAIDSIFSEQIGAAGPDLKALIGYIHELKKFVDSQLARRMPQNGADSESEGAEAGDASASPTQAAPAVAGRIQNSQDVLRRLDELCEYYARNEPSSPIPLLLERAKRLVDKSFLDLLNDLAPGGISELQVVSGRTDYE
jgi:type VI secretion system protein ImpA